MTDNPPLIRVQNLTKRFDTKRILRGVNLAVTEGEVVALLGGNGAGKTTFMRIVAGLLKADRGEIELGGVPMIRAQHELRRYIGFVGHAPLLYEHLSALENLLFFARLYDLQEPMARVEAVLASVDLWRRRNDLVRTYSRGMQQRLAIGRAILHDPPILLFDEPDTGLDQKSSHMLQRLLRHLGAHQRAIIFSTHNLDRALTWADSIAMLADGVMAQRVSTADLNGEALQQLHLAVGMEA
ncbi:MAG: heme ABC exporter ATP-binding protein CcmA [Caldilineaceae bacterium]